MRPRRSAVRSLVILVLAWIYADPVWARNFFSHRNSNIQRRPTHNERNNLPNHNHINPTGSQLLDSGDISVQTATETVVNSSQSARPGKRLQRLAQVYSNAATERLFQIRNKAQLRKQKKHGAWKPATRLTGGAETPTETETQTIDTDQEAASSKRTTGRAFLGNLGSIRKQSLKLPKALVKNNGTILQSVKSGMGAVQKKTSKVAPSFVTALSLLYSSKKGVSFSTLYALSLLGSSCGFYLFLYFIATGYALGVGVPLLVALVRYTGSTKLPRPSFLHSVLTVLWSARLVTFYVWREYFSWPALHDKVVDIQSKMSIPLASRILCWFVYSFFYIAMMSMNWSRLAQGSAAKWGILGCLGLLLQMGGLTMETISDLQKNGFKSRFRHSWCNVGLWKWSTHPNYLGEGLFWWGTYLAHGFHSIPHSILATVGLIFITVVLKGSTRSLSMKHVEKYGDQPEFFEFHRTHSIWGPKRWWWWLHGMEDMSATIVSMEGTNSSGINASAVDDTALQAFNA